MTPSRYIEVAVPTPLFQTFTYAMPDGASVDAPADGPVEGRNRGGRHPGSVVPERPEGYRVVVPFGRQKMVGVVLGSSVEPPAGLDPAKLKRALSWVDDHALFSERQLHLARWLAAYYYFPIGEVLRAMLPAGVRKNTAVTVALTESGLAAVQVDPTLGECFAGSGKAKGPRKHLALATLRKKLKSVGQDPDTAIEGWLRQKWIVRHSERRVTGRGVVSSSPVQEVGLEPPTIEKPELRSGQQSAVDAVMGKGLRAVHPQKPFLLVGVTGSGKTEVYLRLIEECLRESDGGSLAQALVLVPEIALTPQMTRIFEARFPGQVCVVHSAMLDTERWDQLNRIRAGDARILIGPRSAVFAGFQNLRLIVVDEEHDASYKQATGLMYNGRDVAVMRGRVESATVVLGSATPALESYHNALNGRYELIELPERISGRPLPQVAAVQTNPAWKKGTVIGRDISTGQLPAPLELDPRVAEALRENLAAGNQSIVLVNRRGYAYYLYSLNNRAAVSCPNCSISLTVHGKFSRLRCHYCDFATTIAAVMKKSPDDTFITVGYGSERAEEALQVAVPEARVMRLDADTVADRELLPATLAKFRNREVDILVGTQILAKGHDFPAVTLVVIIEIDQMLSLPDFRAGERTFQLIVQAAGRAGRAGLPGRVLIQSARFSHPVVQLALAQDYKTFANSELEFRKSYGYPPFSRMISVEWSGTDQRKLDRLVTRIDQWLESAASTNEEILRRVKVLGPATPPLEIIRGRHRRNVLLVSYQPEALRALLPGLLGATEDQTGDIRVRVDVDPQSLM